MKKLLNYTTKFDHTCPSTLDCEKVMMRVCHRSDILNLLWSVTDYLHRLLCHTVSQAGELQNEIKIIQSLTALAQKAANDRQKHSFRYSYQNCFNPMTFFPQELVTIKDNKKKKRENDWHMQFLHIQWILECYCSSDSNMNMLACRVVSKETDL